VTRSDLDRAERASRETGAPFGVLGLDEELALARLAVVEEEDRAARLWAARNYDAAFSARREAEEARRYVSELEGRENGGNSSHAGR